MRSVVVIASPEAVKRRSPQKRLDSAGDIKRMPKLAPRTAFGISADGRYLYVLVVDGRQKNYSLGADMLDLVRLLKAAGASDAINMDGGGSSTLVRYDQSGGGVVIDNRHDPDRYHYRNVAVSLGFYLP